tara:strand:+ start:1688 stop:1864 length:177 start_codon:yes stop_codon:yes gene_type:complete
MPYIIKTVPGGFKVGLVGGLKMSNGRYFLSNKPLTKIKARKQKKAVEMLELKTRVKKY